MTQKIFSSEEIEELRLNPYVKRITCKDRIKEMSRQCKKMAVRPEVFADTWKGHSARPVTRELSDKEKIARLEHQVEYLKQENAFLKKNRISRQEVGLENKAEARPDEKYKIIREMTQRDNNRLNIKWLLCEMAGVSRSGYYY